MNIKELIRKNKKTFIEGLIIGLLVGIFIAIAALLG